MSVLMEKINLSWQLYCFAFCYNFIMVSMFTILKFVSPSVRRPVIKQPKLEVRHKSFLQRLRPQSVLLDKSKHNLIYEFPYILHTSLLIRTKFWFPVIVTTLSPLGLLFEKVGFSALGYVIASWLHSGFVHLISKQADNMIGKVYMNHSGDTCQDIIISALDSDGNRIDRCHKLNELVLCEFSTKVAYSMGFIRINVEDTNLTYKINVFDCKIHDYESCALLLGKKWLSKNPNVMK